MIDESTGIVTVAKEANLDILRSGDVYQVVVQAVDSGKPFPRTGEATVNVFIEDVNDKKPEFEHVRTKTLLMML